MRQRRPVRNPELKRMIEDFVKKEGISKGELAERCGLERSAIAYFYTSDEKINKRHIEMLVGAGMNRAKLESMKRNRRKIYIHNTASEVGKLINQARLEKRMTVDDFSKRAGISFDYITEIVRGRSGVGKRATNALIKAGISKYKLREAIKKDIENPWLKGVKIKNGTKRLFIKPVYKTEIGKLVADYQIETHQTLMTIAKIINENYSNLFRTLHGHKATDKKTISNLSKLGIDAVDLKVANIKDINKKETTAAINKMLSQRKVDTIPAWARI